VTTKPSKRHLGREEILAAIGWKPLTVPGVPAKVLREWNRQQADYLVAWARGLAKHLERADGKRDRKPRPVTPLI